MGRKTGPKGEICPLSYAAICSGSHMLPKEFAPPYSPGFHTRETCYSRGAV